MRPPILTLQDYAIASARTQKRVPGAEFAHYAVWTLGLVGEAGEVAEHIKKYLGHGKPLDVIKVREELGDVLWYVNALSNLCGLTFEEVARFNIAKLHERYPNGFNP